jgi:hypothetical protein
MSIRTITRLAKTVGAALALGALVASGSSGASIQSSPDWPERAAAGLALETLPANYAVDDHFRDGAVVATTSAQPDWFERAAARHADHVAVPDVLRADYAVDDHFRDATPREAVPAGIDGFDWIDFGIGAGSACGALLLAAALGGLAIASRRGSRMLRRT